MVDDRRKRKNKKCKYGHYDRFFNVLVFSLCCYRFIVALGKTVQRQTKMRAVIKLKTHYNTITSGARFLVFHIGPLISAGTHVSY